MPKFFYTARDRVGNKITAYEEAPHQEEVVSRLQARGLIVINVILGTPPEKEVRAKVRHRRYRMAGGELVLFCRQLTTLLGAGVTILKTLDIISAQVASRKFYNIIKDLEKNMEQGLSLHESMAKHPAVFSDLWINLVESGEASGNLAVVLERLANYLERNAEFKRRIISALIYPTLLLVVGTGALLFLTIKIIPTFVSIFQGFNLRLPLITQLIIQVSLFIRRFFFLFIIVIIIFYYIFKKYTRTTDGRKRYEKFKLGLPIFGEFFRALVIERFSSEVSTLIESGVPILYSLEITEKSVDNLVMADIIRKIKEDVRNGRPLSQPLEQSGFFEPMVVQMVNIGEEIGELSQMFKRINTFYQGYVETFLARFVSLFEPLMLVFMGIVIGIMVVGMFLPIFQISQIGFK